MSSRVHSIDAKSLARHIAAAIQSRARRAVPTLGEFLPRYVSRYMEANRRKPSAIHGHLSICRTHLLPRFGSKPLDEVSEEEIETLKVDLSKRSPKTVNNILSALNRMLCVAVKWRVLDEMPVTIEFLPKEDDAEITFYEFAQYRRLIAAARQCGARILSMVLLCGDAGLRLSEMIALDPRDIDFLRNILTVKRSVWRGQLIPTKGRRLRHIPMTKALRLALQELQPKGTRVILSDDGKPLTLQQPRYLLMRAQRAAGLPAHGAMHVLRHTFCSHLAMRGAPALAISKLAGHRSMRTTMRYLHLSQGEADRAIRLLDTGRVGDCPKK